MGSAHTQPHPRRVRPADHEIEFLDCKRRSRELRVRAIAGGDHRTSPSQHAYRITCLAQQPLRGHHPRAHGIGATSAATSRDPRRRVLANPAGFSASSTVGSEIAHGPPSARYNPVRLGTAAHPGSRSGLAVARAFTLGKRSSPWRRCKVDNPIHFEFRRTLSRHTSPLPRKSAPMNGSCPCRSRAGSHTYNR